MKVFQLNSRNDNMILQLQQDTDPAVCVYLLLFYMLIELSLIQLLKFAQILAESVGCSSRFSYGFFFVTAALAYYPFVSVWSKGVTDRTTSVAIAPHLNHHC